MDSCGDCRFWRGDKFSGQCKRSPPVAAFQVAFDGSGAAHYETLWPNTAPSDWCGEHQPLSAKVAEGVNGELLAALRDAKQHALHIETALREVGRPKQSIGEMAAALVLRLDDMVHAVERAEEASR